MDSILKDRLTKWHSQIDVLCKAEKSFFDLESSKDSLWGLLYLQTSGTVADRQAITSNHETWKEFMTKYIDSKVEYLKQKRVLDVKIKAYEAEYGSFKREHDAVNNRRQTEEV